MWVLCKCRWLNWLLINTNSDFEPLDSTILLPRVGVYEHDRFYSFIDPAMHTSCLTAVDLARHVALQIQILAISSKTHFWCGFNWYFFSLFCPREACSHPESLRRFRSHCRLVVVLWNPKYRGDKSECKECSDIISKSFKTHGKLACIDAFIYRKCK